MVVTVSVQACSREGRAGGLPCYLSTKTPKSILIKRLFCRKYSLPTVGRPQPFHLSCSCRVGTRFLLTPFPSFLAVDASSWMSAQEMPC